MTKNKIEDLPKDDEINENEMKSISGGVSTASPQILQSGSINLIDVKTPSSDLANAAVGLTKAIIGSTK